MYGFCVQSLIMSWIQELEILQRRCRRSFTSKWSDVYNSRDVFSCVVKNVWWRCGALPVVDALLYKLWLFYLFFKIFFTQVGLRWPRSLLSADVPDQFKRLSAQRGWFIFSFSHLSHLFGGGRGNWRVNKIWTAAVLFIGGVWNQAACVVLPIIITVPSDINKR